jgi:hypothetical protein
MNEFVICINNDSNLANLILGKVYRTLPDAEAKAHDMLRVIDEDTSEVDGCLYPASMLVPIELPEVAERALAATDSGAGGPPKQLFPSRATSPILPKHFF